MCFKPFIWFQAIHSIIQPAIKENEVQEFLWSHMLRNIDDLKEKLQSSTDDVMVLMHVVMNNFSTHKGDAIVSYVSL